MEDNTGTKCTNCKFGIYKETQLLDDLSGVLHCDKCNKQINRYNMSVKAKFVCQSITEFTTGKNVDFIPVMSGSEENKSFSKYTPAGNLSLNISPETQAHDYFKVGVEYYLTIEEA